MPPDGAKKAGNPLPRAPNLRVLCQKGERWDMEKKEEKKSKRNGKQQERDNQTLYASWCKNTTQLMKESESRSVVSDSLWPHGLYSPWNFPGQKWVTFPFFRGSFQPRDRTQVCHIAGRFFTSWATREAQEYWSGSPIPSPGNLHDPDINPGSPTLQVDFLPTELSGKQIYEIVWLKQLNLGLIKTPVYEKCRGWSNMVNATTVGIAKSRLQESLQNKQPGFNK